MEIHQCKFCKGQGKYYDHRYQQDTPCPICNGAGEIYLEIDRTKAVNCKFCKGQGKYYDHNESQDLPCPSCKGVGYLERNTIIVTKKSNKKIVPQNNPRPASHDYNIAVSFAGEDRELVEEYIGYLKKNYVSVFYDNDKKWDLWGKDLYEKLDEIYRLKARYCVIFISEHYADKLWTTHERKSAQTRAFKENKEYILPVRLDDTEIPGIRETIGYLDLRKISTNELAQITLKKLKG